MRRVQYFKKPFTQGDRLNGIIQLMIGPYMPNNKLKIPTESPEWVRTMRSCTLPQLKVLAMYETLCLVYPENSIELQYMTNAFIRPPKITDEGMAIVLRRYELAASDSKVGKTKEELDNITFGPLVLDEETGTPTSGMLKLLKKVQSKYWQWYKSGHQLLKPIKFNDTDSRGNLHTVFSYNIIKHKFLNME